MPAIKKRLIVCLDGTGQDSVRGENEFITNVTRFARCVRPTAADAIQIVYYHEGPGVHQDGDIPGNALRDAAKGQGVHALVQDAYYFLCLNYEENSEIYLAGFSRGAFAARALACLIDEVGLLKRYRLACLPMVYDLWKTRDSSLDQHLTAWAVNKHIIRDVDIIACGVWDTVNSMRCGMSWSNELKFVEDKVPGNIKHAFHCLALHETRDDFLPVLWNNNLPGTNVRECWFAGDHSDIGGGFADSALATITLMWMVAQFKEFTDIDFEDVMLLDCMSPQYLEWKKNSKKKTSGTNSEYTFKDHSFTKGNIHGAADWDGPGKYYFGWRSHADARKEHLKTRFQSDMHLPPKFVRAKKPLAQVTAKSIDVQLPTDLNTAVLDEDDSSVRNGRTGTDTTATSDTEPQPGSRLPTFHRPPRPQYVHFTVRVLMKLRKEDRKQSLENFRTVYESESKSIWWEDSSTKQGLWEDNASEWESWMFRQWIKREEKRFQDDQEGRFTHLLRKYRAESWARPPKLLYDGTPPQKKGPKDRHERTAPELAQLPNDNEISVNVSANSGVWRSIPNRPAETREDLARKDPMFSRYKNN